MAAVKWFLKLDRRIIYVIVALAIIIPLLWPMGLPIHTTPPVEAVYKDIDKLPAGSRVWIAFDYDPSSQPELQPMALALLKHCFSKKLRVITMTLWPGGPNLIVQALDEMKKEFGVVDGTDFVNMGYKPGGYLVIIGAGQNIKDTFTTDMFGKSTGPMPILSDIKSMKDIDYCVEIGAGNSIDWWIAYGHQQYGYPLAIGCTAVSATQYYPYLGSGQ